LLLMFFTEPILHCFNSRNGDFVGAGLFTQTCPGASDVKFVYSVFSMCAMVLYYVLLIDLTVISMRLSAFTLMCGHVLQEVGMCVVALVFSVLGMSASTSALNHESAHFDEMYNGALTFSEIACHMLRPVVLHSLSRDKLLFMVVACFVILTIFLFGLLVAQLTSSYTAIYQSMLGFARLNRIEIIVETMPSVKPARWDCVVKRLKLEERLEFSEGDLGIAGGVQVWESAAAFPTYQSSIRRFGGSTSPEMPWPEDDTSADNDENKFDRLEKLIQKTLKRFSAGKAGRKRDHSDKKGTSSGSGSVAYSASDAGTM